MGKVCFKCKNVLPINFFYRHYEMADGHLNKCKECTKNDVIINRKKNIEKYRKYDRNRGARHGINYLINYRLKYKNKYKAVLAVNNAIKIGKLLKQPCEICGDKYTHAHHDDYSNYLGVRWLCPVHHSEWHINNGQGLNG